MKYAIGNRVNFVQFDSQFSNEMEMFLSEYAGNNSSKYHKALSVIMQVIMRAGNTGGYFLSAKEDDILLHAKAFNVGVSELKAIYDVATRRDVFDREQYLKNNIITNNSLQIAFLKAKTENSNWDMCKEHILEFVYKFFKSSGKNLKLVAKLDKLLGINQRIEQNGVEQNGTESESIETLDCDMTLTDFKNKHPRNCINLPDDWEKPKGVSLKKISEAIENSSKFLAVKNYMSLDKLATDYYQKVIIGYYDDSKYDVNIQKNAQNFSDNHNYSDEQLKGLYDNAGTVNLG